MLAGIIGVWILLSPAPTKSVAAISLAPTTNSPSTSANEFTFRLKNSDHREIVLSEVFVEVKTPGGWKTITHQTPTADQFVHSGDSKDLPVAVPDGTEPWRLRIAYGLPMDGVGLFLLKFSVAVQRGKFPGAGFGAFSGSNSLSSTEIPR